MKQKAMAGAVKVKDPIDNVANNPLSDSIPDAFPKTQQVPMLQTMKLHGTDRVGQYVSPYYSKDGTAYIQLSDPDYSRQHSTGPNFVAGHEAGHAIYDLDINSRDRDAWADVHNRTFAKFAQVPSTPVENQLANFGWDKKRNLQRFNADSSHSFAEAYGLYMQDPEWLQQNAPLMYDYFKRISGFEYKRRQTDPLGQSEALRQKAGAASIK